MTNFTRTDPVHVAVCGHFNHGKTTLVRTLTGRETDTLPEEKKRGTTIEPTRVPLPQAPHVHLIDVPGQRDYIRNMLATAWTADHILLLVAADEGVCPGTTDHLIVALFHGSTIQPIITKTDIVPDHRIEQVTNDITTLLEELQAPTTGPPIHASPPTGEGIDEIIEHLAHLQPPPRPPADTPLRAPIENTRRLDDHTVKATGIIDRGTLTADEPLTLQPHNTEVTLLELEPDPAPPGHPFRAVIETEETVNRGAVLGHNIEATDTLTARVLALNAKARPGTQIKLHALTDARVATFTHVRTEADTDTLRPYAEGHNVGHATLRLDRPTVLEPGDRALATMGNEPALLLEIEG